MTGLISNVEQILPIISTISIISGILAIGLMIITVLLWATQPIKILPAHSKKEGQKECIATPEKKEIVVRRNANTVPVQKFNNLITLGFMPTSGWVGTNHTEKNQGGEHNE